MKTSLQKRPKQGRGRDKRKGEHGRERICCCKLLMGSLATAVSVFQKRWATWLSRTAPRFPSCLEWKNRLRRCHGLDMDDDRRRLRQSGGLSLCRMTGDHFDGSRAWGNGFGGAAAYESDDPCTITGSSGASAFTPHPSASGSSEGSSLDRQTAVVYTLRVRQPLSLVRPSVGPSIPMASIVTSLGFRFSSTLRRRRGRLQGAVRASLDFLVESAPRACTL